MRSLLGRFHRPFARGTEDQLLLLNNLGDGSTLSLDFTTGVLDPRLTFTRLSDATFINSSGRVEWSAANYFRNTGWVTSTTPTGWNVTFGTGTTTWNNDGTLTMNTGGSSTRPCINANSFTVSQGIAYTFGYTVVSVSGSPQITSVISSTLVGDTFAINGTTVGPTTVVQAGDVVSCTFTPTGTTAIPRMGPGVNTGMTNTAMTITRPQMNPGVTLQPYLLNTSTSVANNNTPRFDYDPTAIGTPRGLLIEGSANNLCLNSEDFSAWNTANTSLASESGDTNPDGITVPTRVSDNSTNGEHYRGRTPSLTTATTYTKSVWFKNPATNGRRYGGLQLFAGGGTDTGGVVAVWDFDTGQSVSSLTFGYGGKPTPSVSCVPYKSGWYRVSISMTVTGTLTALNHRIVLSNGTATSYANSGTALGLLVWGAQLETGSGASSYIPTGASTGSRAADVCYADNISSWYTQGIGTMLFVGRPIQSLTRNYLGFSTGTNPPRLLLYGSNATEVALYLENSTAANLIFPSGSTTLGSVNRMAASFEQAGYSCVLNGGTVGTSTTASPAMPTSGINRMNIGMRNDQFNQFYGHVVQVKYWPYRLPNAQLQSLTT